MGEGKGEGAFFRTSTISSYNFVIQNFIKDMAEGEGFEPPVELPPQRLQS